MNRRGWQSAGVLAGVVALVMVGGFAETAEHGGKEHAGSAATQEHAGTPATSSQPTPSRRLGNQPVKIEPSAEQLRDLIAAYVKEKSAKAGTFTIKDDVTRTTRQLKFVRVHQRVGKTGNSYYSCTDMKDTKTGELLDLDFDVAATGGTLKVIDTRIHKVQGKARYTYDEHDQRIPVR